MDFKFFFEGKFSREEAASAFLAMALDASPAFLNHFLGLLGEEFLAPSRRWEVTVEDQRVDITLRSGDAVVLIENKLSSGAMQADQLLRYYRDEVDRDTDHQKQIVAVLLSPEGIGKATLETLTSCDEFAERQNLPEGCSNPDIARHISWAEVLAFDADGATPWLRSGLDAIQEAIERATRAVYLPHGDRGLIRLLMDDARDRIHNATGLELMRFSGKTREHICTIKSSRLPLTIRAVLEFMVEDTEPYLVKHAVVGDQFHLTLHLGIALRHDVKAKSAEWHRWREAGANGTLDVAGVGALVAQHEGEFRHSETLQGSREDIVARVDRAFRHLLDAGRQIGNGPDAPDTSA